MMYAYFPGCSAHSTGISYTNSYSYVALAAGIELAEIPNWSLFFQPKRKNDSPNAYAFPSMD